MVLIPFVLVSFFVPSPWNVAVLICGIVAEIGEILWGRRLARKLPVKTGSEAMIGRKAKVVETCRPDGRVRVRGELWEATCADGADVGDRVTIVAEQDLRLQVVHGAG
jgi:membrane protein implicated in regulation of membrane protease activity